MQMKLKDGRVLIDGVLSVMAPIPEPPPRIYTLKLRHKTEDSPSLTASSPDLKKLLAFHDEWAADYILVTLA